MAQLYKLERGYTYDISAEARKELLKKNIPIKYVQKKKERRRAEGREVKKKKKRERGKEGRRERERERERERYINM